MCCLVDSHAAGNGRVSAQVKAPTTHPPVMITETDGLTALSFVPVETGEHLFFVTFGTVNIPGDSQFCDRSQSCKMFLSSSSQAF